MPKPQLEAALPLLETAPKSKSDIPTARATAPIDDRLATTVGKIMVSWGSFSLQLKNYTRCLSDYNGVNDELATQRTEFKRVASAFDENYKIAFSGSSLLIEISRELLKRARRAQDTRNKLAHEQLFMAIVDGKSVVGTRYFTKDGKPRNAFYGPNRLENSLQDIEKAHGRLLQMALATIHPLPCSSHEKSLLQAVLNKGYLSLPIANTN